MEAMWVNAFCTTTVNVIKTMFAVEAKPGTPRLKVKPYPESDISSMIGFSGEAQGSIALSFPQATALKIVSTLLGETMTELNSEVSDAIGELVNIVAGNAKTAIPQFKLSISLPQVVIGAKHVVSCQTTIPVVIIPFSTPMGDFAMELSLKKN